MKKNVVMSIALASVAIETMANPGLKLDIEKIAEKQKTTTVEDFDASDLARFEGIGLQMVKNQAVIQSLANSWFNLSSNLYEDGLSFKEKYDTDGQFMEIQQSASVGAGACYTACYGNCYANCYQNCYKNCHSADS